MFLYVTRVKKEILDVNRLRGTYQIVDTCFVDTITIESVIYLPEYVSLYPVAIALTYLKRKLYVPRNLALYYIFSSNVRYIIDDMSFIKNNYPEFTNSMCSPNLITFHVNEMKKNLSEESYNLLSRYSRLLRTDKDSKHQHAKIIFKRYL